MPLIVIGERDEAFADAVRTLLVRDPAYQVVVAPTLAMARDVARRDGARVVVLGPSNAIDGALDVGAELAASRPPVAVLLVVERVTTELLRRALRAGFKDVLAVGGNIHGEVAKSVREAYDSLLAARDLDMGVVETPVTQVSLAKMVTVFGTKGGIGKSVLATNLAVALAQRPDTRVVLVDLALESGDVGIMLNVQPLHTVLDAAQAIDRLDTTMLSGLLVAHESGIRVLLAPVRPEDAELVPAAQVGRILDLVRQVADVVVVDTPGAINESLLTAIDKSDVVLAVSTMDMPSVKNMRIALQKLGQLGYRDGLIRLVLNRADSKVLMDVADVEDALGRRVFARIPSDRLVPRSVNKGVPIVTEMPRSGVARSIIELARAIMANEEVS